MSIQTYNRNMKYTSLQQREIFHFLFLEELLRISEVKLYIVKGGVNLRFFFKSDRYSEDMDIDVLAGGVSTLKKNGYKLLANPAFIRALRTFGIEQVIINDPSRAKHPETTQRFRVQLVTSTGDKLPSKVEFSRRQKSGSDKTEFSIIEPEIARHYNRISFKVQHYSGESAAIQKVAALAGRAVTQCRDVFDLELLLKGGHATKAVIQKLVSLDIQKQAISSLQGLTFESFNGQVLEFLDPRVRNFYDSEDVWEEMKQRVSSILTND